MRIFVLAAALLIAGPVHASGGFWCDNQGGPVKITVQGGVTRGMGSPVFAFRGSAEIDDASIGEDLGKIRFDGTHLAQYWFGDGELRMVLYRERETDPFGSVEIVIMTKVEESVDGVEFKGTYSYKADDAGAANGQGSAVSHSGGVVCGAE